MTKTLLFEIGTEEIPTSFIRPALKAMEEIIKESLQSARIDFGPISTFGTPRRLTLRVEDVSENQKDKVEEIMGPPAKVAFDQDGRPTKAAEGFAKSQGVDISSLRVKETPKGAYVYVFKKEKGGETLELLPQMLEYMVKNIPFKKSMRWRDKELRFARPIHWFLALFGEEIVEFEIENIRSDKFTYGHRFLAPHPVKINTPDEYEEALKRAYIIVDCEERKKLIWEDVQREARVVGGIPEDDDELLEEVSFLVEYPVVTCGSFSPEYLELPPEVLITTMKEHQKYFPIFDKDRKLKNYFVVVNNILSPNMELITRGNERVLKARLADAKFFFDEDKKVPLKEMFEKLRDVVFQEKLGTSYEKVMRFRELALSITERVAPDRRELAERTAFLCKADLESQMVYEFPELQGVMGREYARIQGEPEEVALGIYEHYLPRYAGDQLPTTLTGAIVGIADRLDTLVGCFGIGLMPTGSEDPYGLRRDTLGIIHVILEKSFRISLDELIDQALGLLADRLERDPSQVKEEVLSFFRQRLHPLWVSEGFRHDLTEAVLSAGMHDVCATKRRLEALAQVSEAPSFEDLMITFKRVVNIIPKEFQAVEVDPGLLQEREEKELFEALQMLESRVMELVKNEEYLQAFKTISGLKEKVDAFFDHVLVMTKDERLRNNRLSLLKRIANLFSGLADLSKVVLSK